MLTRAAIGLSVLTVLVSAEQGVLVLHVSNPGKATGGSASQYFGRRLHRAAYGSRRQTRIRLAPQTQPGRWVSLQIARAQQDLVFISPWDSRVRIPPFENESDSFAPVVLAARGDRAVLEMGRTLASLAQV